MSLFENAIQATERAVRRLPQVQVRALQESLRTLNPRQLAFAHNTLTLAHKKRRLPPGILRILDHFFVTWHTHNLAAKLAVIDILTRVSESGEWPEEGGTYSAALDAVGRFVPPWEDAAPSEQGVESSATGNP